MKLASLLLIAAFGLSGPAAASVVVFDNTGGGLGTNIGQVGSQGGTGPDQSLGELFTPGASGDLASITLGVPWVFYQYPNTAPNFFVSIWTNNGGALGTELEQLTGTATEQYSSALHSFALATAASSVHPFLSAGQSYWMVVHGTTNSGLIWQGVAGQPNAPGVEFFLGPPIYFSGQQGSLIVTDLTPVPLPAADGLLLSVLVGLGLATARRRGAPPALHGA
jgi:hypothetical protein